MKERLAELIKASGFTQDEAAEATGKSSPTISSYLCGRRRIPVVWFNEVAVPVLTRRSLERMGEISETLQAVA